MEPHIDFPFDTNVWNALRYILFTLAILPLAERLWARSHSLRSGSRALRGRPVRLRKSKLSYWGLHQEVDEHSRLSKVTAICLCILHIAGTLLIEYGSSSEERPIVFSKFQSPRIQTPFRLPPNQITFVDGLGLTESRTNEKRCVDGRPRRISDFGLVYEKLSKTRIVDEADLDVVLVNEKLMAQIDLDTISDRFDIYDSNTSRSYFSFVYGKNVLLTTEKQTCWRYLGQKFLCEENRGGPNPAKALAQAIAISGMAQYPSTIINRNRIRGSKLMVNLSLVAVQGLGIKPNATSTSWIRRGMPREEASRFKSRLYLHIHQKALLDSDCKSEGAVAVMRLRHLRVSSRSLHYNRLAQNTSIRGTEVAWVFGRKIFMGLQFQIQNGSCASLWDDCVCVSRHNKSVHAVGLYKSKIPNESTVTLEQYGRLSVHGRLTTAHQLDVVALSILEIRRERGIGGEGSYYDLLHSVANLIEKGQVVSGAVRVSGDGVVGTSVKYQSNQATLTVFGMVGAAILVLILLVPSVSLCSQRCELALSIESSFRRAAMESDGVRNVSPNPHEPPDIMVSEVFEGKPVLIRHTYQP